MAPGELDGSHLRIALQLPGNKASHSARCDFQTPQNPYSKPQKSRTKQEFLTADTRRVAGWVKVPLLATLSRVAVATRQVTTQQVPAPHHSSLDLDYSHRLPLVKCCAVTEKLFLLCDYCLDGWRRCDCGKFLEQNSTAFELAFALRHTGIQI